jgi:hypothetical protein
VPTPQPDGYPERVADDHYNLDRWTRPDGVADRELDATHAAMGDVRKKRARAAPDVGDLATLLRDAFPAVAAVKAPVKPPSRLDWAYEAITGKRAPRPATAEDWTAVIGQGGIYVGLVWGLALWLFGRESDPLPEHAIGRMLPGVPVREMRAPFSSPTAALFTADHELPMLGGGAMSLEIAMPKKRTWSKPDEMKVHSTHGGTAHIRGEQSVNRCLSARGAVARAGLAPHEVAAAQVLADKDLMHVGVQPDTAQVNHLPLRRKARIAPPAGAFGSVRDAQHHEPDAHALRCGRRRLAGITDDVGHRPRAWVHRCVQVMSSGNGGLCPGEVGGVGEGDREGVGHGSSDNAVYTRGVSAAGCVCLLNH